MIKTKSLKQVVTVKADPHTVYETLMDDKLHSRLTGAGAVIERRVSGSFSTFDGYSTGKNLELIADRKIMQTWRAGDWEPGVYSKITFEFKKLKNGTQITFTQTGIPPAQFKSISKGWEDYYWKPMKKMFK